MRIFIVWGEERGDEGAISKCVCMKKMKKIRSKKVEERKRDYYCLFLPLLGGEKEDKS